MVMEFAEGGDLLGKIKANERTRIPFPEPTVIKMFIQMIAGLKELHDLKIMHRDIKVFFHLNDSVRMFS